MEENVIGVRLEKDYRMIGNRPAIHRIIATTKRNGRTEDTVVDWGVDPKETAEEYRKIKDWFESPDPQPYDCMFTRLKKFY